MRQSPATTITVLALAGVALLTGPTVARAQSAQELYDQGRAALDRGALPDAVALLSRAIDASPSLLVALRDRGDAKRRSKDFTGALADLDAYLGRVETDARAFNLRSSTRLDTNDAEGALADANLAVSIDPTSITALVNRGRAHSRLSAKEEALADYSLAIAVAPNTAMAWNNRGFVRRDLGDTERALEDFQKALSIDPQLANAKRGIESIKLMKGTSAPPPMPGEVDSLGPPPPLDPPGGSAGAGPADPSGSAWSAERREAVVLGVVRGERTVGQAAEKNGLGLSAVKLWYDTFLEGGRAALAARMR